MISSLSLQNASQKDIDALNTRLNKVGVSFTMLHSGDFHDVIIDIDEKAYFKAVKRNAGRPYAVLKEGNYIAHITKREVLERQKTETMEAIAASLHISRRTLYRRLNEARSDSDELL